MEKKQIPPPGQNSVSPYIVVKNAAGLLDFVKKVFDGAKEGLVMPGEKGIIMHGEIRIGESVIMFADACDRVTAEPARLHIYVADVDAAYQRALDAGATSEREPADQFYGDRSAGVVDPFGVTWFMATPVEDVSPEELQRRHDEMMQSGE